MRTLATYAPFADSGFDELVRGCFRPVRVDKVPATIRMDVVERHIAYVVNAEIPDVAKDDIQVSIVGKQVAIGAEARREPEAKDGGRVLRSETYRGSVHRGFTLPVQIDESAGNAGHENGVLELALVKKAAVAGRKLTVQ